jgi:hypothetical protein
MPLHLERHVTLLCALTLAACSSAQGADPTPAITPTTTVPLLSARGYPGAFSLGAAYSVAQFTVNGPIEGDAVLLLEYHPGKTLVWRELATGKAGPFCVLCHELDGCSDTATVVSLQSSVACVDATGALYLGSPDSVAATTCPYREVWKGAALECLPGPAPYCGAGGHACLGASKLTVNPTPIPTSIRLVTPD